MAIVETQNLTRIYKMGAAEVHALQGVDLVVEQGEFVSVMGRSGSGKSTLLHLVGCLDRPTEGVIRLDGLEVTGLPKRRLPRIRREKVGFVFQQFNLLSSATALENVMLPLRYSDVGRREGRQRAQALLEEVGLGERVTHRPTEMSGGEQQRVAVARALINNPAIVLADEPTGELDTHTAGEIISVLHELNTRDGQTFIIVTHDPLVAESTDRTIYLQDGIIVDEVRRRRVNGYLSAEQAERQENARPDTFRENSE
ncbi:MAG: ABC transporter ATP-binding protein [Chloroflexota bacterium]|nr:ABC transporter ATP-binding protein [Chloroflexota bacterium]